jgi:hypothetical protein
MHTPAQSMLRRPAASAAVMACVVIATNESPYNMKSLLGRLHIDSLRWFAGTYAAGSSVNSA